MKYLAIVGYKSKLLSERSDTVALPLCPKTKEIISHMEKWVIDSNDALLCNRYHLRPALGIAAVQVGYKLRMFYLRTAAISQFFINPEIIETSWDRCYLKGGEGCLSVLDHQRKQIFRHANIKIKYYNYKNDKFVIDSFFGLAAVIIQHEVDHLDGIIYLDRATNQNNNLKVKNDQNVFAVAI